jgi:hypothetical protein
VVASLPAAALRVFPRAVLIHSVKGAPENQVTGPSVLALAGPLSRPATPATGCARQYADLGQESELALAVGKDHCGLATVMAG